VCPNRGRRVVEFADFAVEYTLSISSQGEKQEVFPGKSHPTAAAAGETSGVRRGGLRLSPWLYYGSLKENSWAARGFSTHLRRAYLCTKCGQESLFNLEEVTQHDETCTGKKPSQAEDPPADASQDAAATPPGEGASFVGLQV